jgi:Transglutaminase-like domain
VKGSPRCLEKFLSSPRLHEQIKTPDLFLLIDKQGDCDDYATLWMAILHAVDVKAQPKIVDYESDGYWDHIYVIVPIKDRGYLTLDNVAGKFRKTFNVEVDRKDEKIFRNYKG